MARRMGFQLKMKKKEKGSEVRIFFTLVFKEFKDLIFSLRQRKN